MRGTRITWFVPTLVGQNRVLTCKEDITTRSGLKKVHSDFESIYRRLDNAYTGDALDDRVKVSSFLKLASYDHSLKI